MASRLTTFIVALIVGGTFIAGLIVGAQREDENGPVDLIITNGRVFTGAGEAFAEALAVRDNKILRVGSNREIKRMRRPQTLMLDAHGASVLPGLIDAHVHLGAAAAARAGVDLTGADTPDDIQARLAAFAESHPQTGWIRGRGWSPDAFADTPSPRALLDEALPGRPAYLLSADGGTAWVNTAALTLAGITRQTANPRNGLIVRDPRTGEPTGTLRDAAGTLVARALPELTEIERLEGLEAAIAEAHRAGVTSVHSLGDTVGDLALYEALRAQDGLRLRVYSALAVPGTPDAPDTAALDALQKRFPDDPLLKAGGAFVSLAGAAGRATRREDLESLATLIDSRGWQLLIEAPGEGALTAAVDAVEAARRVNEDNDRPRRDRLEGVTRLSRASAKRLANLDLTATVQPDDETFTASTCRLAARAGARLAFGTGWPEAPVDPLRALAAVVPEAEAGDTVPRDGDDSLPLEQALESYTAVAAWASFDEQRKGRLARGMLADIVILSTDVFTPGRRLSDAEVDTTIFDGKVVYTRAALMGTH